MTSETEMTTLYRKRFNIKSQITKLANALVEKTEHSIPKLQAQLDIVSKLQEKFELLKNDYYKITNQTEFTEVESALDSVEDDLLNLEVSLKTSINQLKCNVESVSLPNQSKGAPIKLPKISLPTFCGRFEEWNLFKTQFSDLINENSQLSDNENLHYLRGSFKGEAEIIETADDDFSSLFKALEQRYENKRVIVDCHIKNILNLQVMKLESSEDLRILLDKLS
ncbi:hypothetical protein AVEN_224871-1 [Araneus ventricosus]|uniref:Uncharacterized protein n=1 Tax=Araneus ventricosus TaxID=182803 RepID=A0A4Y2GVR2_ARAVE|nr:hypothetical protein AVEN_224871-1 [Araneus ventricosus]